MLRQIWGFVNGLTAIIPSDIGHKCCPIDRIPTQHGRVFYRLLIFICNKPTAKFPKLALKENMCYGYYIM